MASYYNENDPKAAAWLRELIKEGLIAPGEVDERSITDVKPGDLTGFIQCHFFAGIAGWSYALRLAGWSDERPVWTCSCPCQPFSVGSVGNGGARGQNDSRHLWPDFFSLARERAPAIVFGEQVASAIRWGWLDRAALDFEGMSHAFASAVLPTNAFGAKHQRKRLYWMAHAGGARRQGHQHGNGLSGSTRTPQSINGDALDLARRALENDLSDLLPRDGVSVQMERDAVKGYGNAIVPQVAANFIQACTEAIEMI